MSLSLCPRWRNKMYLFIYLFDVCAGMICFFFLSPTVLCFASFHGLVVSGWGIWTDRVFSLSPGFAQPTPINNNNNNWKEPVNQESVRY